MKQTIVRTFGMCATLALLLAACQPAGPGTAARSSEDPGMEPGVAAGDTIDLPATNYYEITTPQGRMVVQLFDGTPIHRDNFKKLVKDGFYDGTLFHRVVDRFMIQGGDPNSKDGNPNNDGEGGPGYTIPAELDAGYYHTRGALAAARMGDPVNPERRSSGSQFYIVQGEPLPPPALDQILGELRQSIPDASFAFPDSIRTLYMEEGGTPFLDRQYTVFGQLVEGYDVLAAIAAAQTPSSTGRPMRPPLGNRPLEDISMTIRPLPDYAPPQTP